MYDPARDIFTSSEDAPVDQDEDPTERNIDVEARSQPGQFVKNMPKPEVDLKENGGRRRGSEPRPPMQSSSDIQAGNRSKRAFDEVDHGVADSTSESRNNTPSTKKRRLSTPPEQTVGDKDSRPPSSTSPSKGARDYDSPVPMTTSNLPRFSRKKADEDMLKPSKHIRITSRNGADRERSRSPHRRSPDQRRREPRPPFSRKSQSPKPARRSPTPPPKSPPRQRKRPGGASRIGNAEKEALRQRQQEREQEQLEGVKQAAATRGVHDVVRQHYNAVPERGRDWRKTDSRIKGLRSFNNWIKSTVIQKFSPNENHTPGGAGSTRWADGMDGYGGPNPGILVLDIGCGKGGDLMKWQQAPQLVDLYVGVDPAEVSIDQARERYAQMRGGGGRGGRQGRGGRPQRIFQAEFFVKDGFGEWLGDIPIIREVGIDGGVGPGGGGSSSRWGGGGFDVVTMMFCMHYAFESEAKARGMLRNVAGSLKKGGRFIGVIPNSDVITQRVEDFHKKRKPGTGPSATNGHVNGEASDEKNVEDGKQVQADAVPEWGNSIYRVRFPGKTPEDGIFRPPFGWKYSYFMEEAVEEVPEYVVPWEAFRAITEDYNLELQYRRPFLDVWKEEKDDPVLGPLSERMGVRERGRGQLLVSDEEMEAASFYHAFCFYKYTYLTYLAIALHKQPRLNKRSPSVQLRTSENNLITDSQSLQELPTFRSLHLDKTSHHGSRRSGLPPNGGPLPQIRRINRQALPHSPIPIPIPITSPPPRVAPLLKKIRKLTVPPVGRDKVLRTLQYFSRFYAWYLFRTNHAARSIAPFEAMKKHFGFSRKLLRVGKNVEHVKAAAVAADSKGMDPVLKYCAVGRQLGYATYLTLDTVTYLDAAGIRPSTAAKRLQREAYKAWFVGLLFNTVAGVYTLYQLRQKAQSVDRKDGEGVVESKKLERERTATNLQLISDLCDLTVPTAALGYANLDDGIVGLAGTVSSLIGVWGVWKKTA